VSSRHLLSSLGRQGDGVHVGCCSWLSLLLYCSLSRGSCSSSLWASSADCSVARREGGCNRIGTVETAAKSYSRKISSARTVAGPYTSQPTSLRPKRMSPFHRANRSRIAPFHHRPRIRETEILRVRAHCWPWSSGSYVGTLGSSWWRRGTTRGPACRGFPCADAVASAQEVIKYKKRPSSGLSSNFA
jgi:hypothetical protein